MLLSRYIARGCDRTCRRGHVDSCVTTSCLLTRLPSQRRRAPQTYPYVFARIRTYPSGYSSFVSCVPSFLPHAFALVWLLFLGRLLLSLLRSLALQRRAGSGVEFGFPQPCWDGPPCAAPSSRGRLCCAVCRPAVPRSRRRLVRSVVRGRLRFAPGRGQERVKRVGVQSSGGGGEGRE